MEFWKTLATFKLTYLTIKLCVLMSYKPIKNFQPHWNLAFTVIIVQSSVDMVKFHYPIFQQYSACDSRVL